MSSDSEHEHLEEEEEDTEISNPDVRQKYKDTAEIANRIFYQPNSIF